jgi:hypothetical protein
MGMTTIEKSVRTLIKALLRKKAATSMQCPPKVLSQKKLTGVHWKAQANDVATHHPATTNPTHQVAILKQPFGKVR